jgi:uncharacterized protein (UPF0335 family)
MITVEQRVERLNELVAKIAAQVQTIVETKTSETIEVKIKEALTQLVLQTLDEAREEVGHFGQKTHTYMAVDMLYMLMLGD